MAGTPAAPARRTAAGAAPTRRSSQVRAGGDPAAARAPHAEPESRTVAPAALEPDSLAETLAAAEPPEPVDAAGPAARSPAERVWVQPEVVRVVVPAPCAVPVRRAVLEARGRPADRAEMGEGRLVGPGAAVDPARTPGARAGCAAAGVSGTEGSPARTPARSAAALAGPAWGVASGRPGIRAACRAPAGTPQDRRSPRLGSGRSGQPTVPAPGPVGAGPRPGSGRRGGTCPDVRAVAAGRRSGPGGEGSPRAVQLRFGSPRDRPRRRAYTGTACRIRTHESGNSRRPPVWGLNGRVPVRHPPPYGAGNSEPRGPSPCSEARTRRMVPCPPPRNSDVGTLPCRPRHRGAPSRP